MSETWLPVVGYEGSYEVSDLGRVRHGRRVLKGRPLPSGYQRVTLRRNGRRRDAYVHRLVMEAFVGQCPRGQEVRHGPSGKADNRLANLTYGTHIENCEDRARDGAGQAKLTRASADEIRQRVAAGEQMAAVARDCGVVFTTVSRIVKGQRWQIEEAK